MEETTATFEIGDLDVKHVKEEPEPEPECDDLPDEVIRNLMGRSDVSGKHLLLA